jgi:hypothetical protein
MSSWIGGLCDGQEVCMDLLVTVSVSHTANFILTGGLFVCPVAHHVNSRHQRNKRSGYL